jgi:hypothetical protein
MRDVKEAAIWASLLESDSEWFGKRDLTEPRTLTY